MNPMLNLWLIPILPLAGAVINGVFGKKIVAPDGNDGCVVFQRRGICDGLVCGIAVFFARPST